MAELAQKFSNGAEQPYIMAASQTIEKGHLVAVNASGLALPAAQSASLRVVGVCKETVTSGASGTAYVIAEIGVFEFATAAIVQADVGLDCTVINSFTVGDAAASDPDIVVGEVKEIVSATRVRVHVGARRGTTA